MINHTWNFVNNHRRVIEITRNVVAIASISLIAIPLVAPVAIPAMAIAALGIVEVGLDLAVGDNTSAAVGLLCLFPMGEGFKYVTEIGGDAIKGGSKAKNLYKAEGLLKMDLQLFGKETGKVVSSVKWKGFRKGELTTHYKKHVVEMGEFGKITQSQYMKMAKEYAAETSSAFKEGKVGNFIIKYDPNTRRVLVGHGKSREIRTFYKADFRDHDPFQAAIELAKKLSGQ
ncbi:hypothetical protein [Clostridium sporogenes]|uniref:hypothetical protein n=1 Tax=Clostridium sporogenes TaxID=1509 RepID=UPI002237C671|nr:hypothetical protein [Clostridium sporogenes]MCW6111075.1 hypothetical protein [Clostridium sporogenes]